MRRRLAWLASLLLVATLIAGQPAPTVVRAVGGADLIHDYENGCGPAEDDIVPDNSALLRALFGDMSGLPELVAWAADQDVVDYFSPACDVHDRCYGTYGSDRYLCDLAMLRDLAEVCVEVYLRPDFSWTSAFGLGTIWKAPQYVPCVNAVTEMYAAVAALGGDLAWVGLEAFQDAQADAGKAATCDGSRQTSYGGIYLPASAIDLGYKKNCLVIDLAYGAGRWAGTSRQFGAGQQVHWLDSTDDVQATWRTLFDSGYALTNLEYGNGTWVAVLTTGTGIGRQFFTNRGSFSDLHDDIRHAWDEGLIVTEIEHGDGRWLMFASAGTGFDGQRWVRDAADTTALKTAVQRELDAGWWLTKLEYDGDRWLALFAEGVQWNANGMICRSTYHETRVAMDEKAAAGRMLADLEYGEGGWCGVWFEPAATPPPTVPPTAPPTPSATAAPSATPTLDLVDVPDLGGMIRADARTLVRSRGLIFEVAGYRDEGASMAGRVVDQEPMPYGSQITVGSTIRVWLGAEPSFTPTFPDQRISDHVALWLPGYEHGDTIERGTLVQICISVADFGGGGEQPRPNWVLSDFYPADGPGTPIATGSAQPGGTLACYDRDVTGPGGYETFGISLLDATSGAVLEFADLWIYVP